VDRERLAMILGMMGSAHDGEALNAARLAARMLKEAELTWPQVRDGEQERVAIEAARALLVENQQLHEELARLRRPPLPQTWVLPQTPGEQTAQAIEWTAVLTDWERTFAVDKALAPTDRASAGVPRPDFHKDCGRCPRQGAAPMSEAFNFTIFPDRYALQAYRQHATLEEIAALIADTVRPSKNRLPLIKLATFGTRPSPEGCLRYDANVEQITGLECDYDAEVVGFGEAVRIARTAGLRALLYTSPSHSPAKPRWRILCPFSAPLAPKRREKLMNRVNGLYSGIFAPESWSLSQSYYFGRVDGAALPERSLL